MAAVRALPIRAGEEEVRLARRALERATRGTEADLDRAVELLFESVRGLPPDEALRVLRLASTGLGTRLVESVRRGVRAAARAGAEASARGLRVVVGPAAVPAPTGWEAAARLVEARGPAGALPLSPRIHRLTTWTRTRLDAAVTESVRQGESAMALARRIRDDATLNIRPIRPAAIRDLERATAAMGAPGGPEAVRVAAQAADEVRRLAARLVADPARAHATTRAATTELLDRVNRAIANGNAESAQRAVEWWARDKAEYHAKVIARTETTRAYAAAFEAHAREAGYVRGLVWHVADRACCEVCAEQNGREFPIDDLPEMGAHPNCRCYWTHAIDRRAALRAIAEAAAA